MPELTDAQKVMRNNTGQDIAEQIRLLRLQMEGGGLPAGGAAGQIPVKASSTPYDVDWQYPQYSRPNLLVNWYFVGGGSQLGDGVFPINQRGQTSYQGAVTGIDRWRASGASSTVTIDPSGDGIVFTNTSSSNRFYQVVESKSLAGKTVTLSAKCTTINGVRWQLVFVVNNTNYYGGYTDGNFSFYTLTMPADATTIYAEIMLENSGASIKIHAMKLEIGGYQTLAHNEGTEENPNWVLNELPDYGEELVKCNVADGKTVEYTDRFLVLESTYEYARDLTWTAIGGGIAYSAKMQFTYNGATATTVPGYRAVAATIARFSSYRPGYQWVPYIQYNTGEVCIYSAVGASPTDFVASSHISVRAVFEKI